MNQNHLPPFTLDGKNIIITGASSGIGKACAIECSKVGAKLLLIGRNKARLENSISLLHGSGHFYLILDLSNTNEIVEIIKLTIQGFKPIHGFIHCAGIENTIPLQFMNEKKYSDFFNINVIAGFEIAKCISKKPYYIDGLSIVFISSVMGFLGQEGKIAYSASKGALIAGAKSMAIEMVKKSIRVNTISPAIIETEMVKNMFANIPSSSIETIKKLHPMGFGKPEDIAFACIYLLSNAAKWITGTNLIVDGGYSAK